MDIVIYSLMVYFWYHVLCRSAILSKPRAALGGVLPSWFAYLCSCPFCFTFWTTLILVVPVFAITSDWLSIPAYLFGAPVVNHLLGLTVNHLQTPPKL